MRQQQRSYQHIKGYQAIGSFHSEDVDVLMAIDDDVYSPPGLPFEDLQSVYSSDDVSSDFLLDRTTWTFLNHGAFGAALKVGYNRAQQWRLHLERQPLRYFDRDLLPHLVYSARRLAHFTNSTREATTLLPNVTFGLNTVVRGYSRVYGRKSHVVLWDTSYGSLKKIARHLCDRVTEIPVSPYFDEMDQFSDPNEVFEAALQEILDKVDVQGALLILDHTTSNTAVTMPLERLSQLGKESGMLIVVDGAHGLLSQQVDLSKLPNVDFYIGNGHKWLSCPRGIGMMCCPSAELRDTILEEPAIMSHGIGQGYQSRFLWDGCRDYAAALSVPVVLDYWQSRGVENVQMDLRMKLKAAVDLLATEWHGHSDNATLVPLELHSPMMALVRLPRAVQSADGRASTSDDAKRIQDYLFDHFIEVPIKCVNGKLYVRISCHVYNDLQDYAKLAQAVSNYGRR
jgi:selenocysteine lyase/cysteine desulfurase